MGGCLFPGSLVSLRFNFRDETPTTNFDTFPAAILTVFQVGLLAVGPFQLLQLPAAQPTLPSQARLVNGLPSQGTLASGMGWGEDRADVPLLTMSWEQEQGTDLHRTGQQSNPQEKDIMAKMQSALKGFQSSPWGSPRNTGLWGKVPQVCLEMSQTEILEIVQLLKRETGRLCTA